MNIPQYKGLFVATYTPLKTNGELNPDAIQALVDWNIESGAAGLYVCGTTGEGMSLSVSERKVLTTEFIKAAKGRVPVIIQVGHNALPDACELAQHAQSEGADGISAHPPTYYKVENLESLIECSRVVAQSAPNLPFYYYHIPAFTGAHYSMRDFAIKAQGIIPNLAGLKFSDSRVDALKLAESVSPADYNFFWGCDEMLLSGLCNGLVTAIGSTYNVFGKEFSHVCQLFENGQIEKAAEAQVICTKMILAVAQYPFHSAMKALLTKLGAPCGQTRQPNLPISEKETNELVSELKDLGFQFP